MAVCPFASQSKRYDRKYPGSYAAGFPYRLVPHSTETTGLPSYSGGADAPHFTVDPRTGRIWQHFDTARPSRALEHRPGTIDTNNARAIQVEIVAFSDAAACKRAGGLYVGALTAAHQAVVRKLFVWIMRTHGITARTYPTKPYPASYGDNNGVRLSDAAWRVCRGVVEHQGVPHNNHGDAGALAQAPLVYIPTPPPPPTPSQMEDDMQILIREKLTPGQPGTPVFVSNYLTRRHVTDSTELAQIISGWRSSGASAWVCQVHETEPGWTLAAYGVDITPPDVAAVATAHFAQEVAP